MTVNTMVHTCKDCRWWIYMDSFHQKKYPNVRSCQCPALVNIEEHPEGHNAVTDNGFGLDYPVCDLVTGPDFGCVHFEAKSA